MKTVAKLFADLVAWRWAPAAGLLAASTLFVLVVVGLVPTEIGVPVANTKFVPKTAATGTIGPQIAAVQSDNSETTTASFGNAAEATPEQQAQARVPAPVSDFGRRGFSPRLDRPDPPPTPATPPPAPVMQPPVAAPGGPIGGIFSRIQGALRPGSPAAQAAAAALAASANAANTANTAPPAADQAAPQPGAAAAAVPPPPGTPPTPGVAAPPAAPGAPPAYPAPPGSPPQ